MPYMPGARTMARCATGVVRQVTTLKNVILSAIADIAYNAATMELTVFAPMTSAMSSKTAKSIPLTPTSSVATVLPLMMTSMSKGH